MRLPFFRAQTIQESLRLPLPATVDIFHGVYFRAEEPPPAPEALFEAVRDGIARSVGDPLRAVLLEYLDQGILSLSVEPRDVYPAPSAEDLRAMSDREAVDRYERATHVVVVHAPDTLLPPRAGLWCGLAAARALALRLDGVVFDPALFHLAPVDENDLELPTDGRIVALEHILIPYSTDERGVGWITTAGLDRFGLPNLEIRNAPPSLFGRLGHVLNAVAQRLVETMMAAADGPVPEVAIERDLRLSLDDIARSQGEETSPPEEGVRGWTLVGLEHTGKGRRGLEPFISLVPPGLARRDQGEWLYSILNDLLGPEAPENCDYVSSDNEHMEEAHHRAVAALPEVKRRFLAGLETGAQLYVKHGFPTDDHHEYMWIAVSAWKGSRIQGRLANDPFERLDLRAGQAVEVLEKEVYDWMIEGPGETVEGNATGRVAREEG